MEIIQIPLNMVIPSPMNPRKTFDEGELKELADNIEKQGLLQPITVRPVRHPSNEYGDRPDKYEIVCGERRFRAMSLLFDKWDVLDLVSPKGESYNRFTKIPAIVREMSDEEAFDAMITENLQRKDVDPIEEAFAFGQLIKTGKTPEEIALRFGKSIRFVQDRVKLNNLIPELMVAVKDDKMSISAAMLISKLDAESQRRYLNLGSNRIYGYTRESAKRFVDDLFMNIEASMWCKSGNPEDRDFDGGCGHKCSACQNNTANHGCLFWEMKSQDGGKCTDRQKFDEKTLAYILREIDRLGDSLVKAGQPLEFGKTVLCVNESTVRDDARTKSLLAKLKEKIADKGYEIVDSAGAFKSRCYYSIDDERTLEFLEKGEAYRCMRIFDWGGPELRPEVWYVRKDDAETNVSKEGVPYQVSQILNQIKSEKEGLKYKLDCAGFDALNKCVPSSELITDKEMLLVLTCMLFNNITLAKRAGFSAGVHPCLDDLHNFIKSHPGKRDAMIRMWLFQQISGDIPLRVAVSPLLDELCEANCREAYAKNKEKVLDKYNKTKAKAAKELAKLGYGFDGKPLTKAEETPAEEPKTIRESFDKPPTEEMYRHMKAKHPKSILLFRVNDFYEIFESDADEVAEVLKLTVTKRMDGMRLCGFPHHALTTYLPKLVSAGKSVAICENLEPPKK